MARDHDTTATGDATLDPYQQPHLYDLEYAGVDEDVPHYTALAAAAEGRVIELAAGTGRLTLPMARTGAILEAWDQSTAMLERLRAHAEADPGTHITIQLGDMCSFTTAPDAALVVLAFNALQHVDTPARLRQLFTHARAAVLTGGHFALDAYLPREDLHAQLHDTEHQVLRVDTGTGEVWRNIQHSLVQHSGRTLVTETTWISWDGTTVHKTRMVQRLYPLPWLLRVVQQTGWEVVHSWSDYEGTPAHPDALKWVAVLRAI